MKNTIMTFCFFLITIMGCAQSPGSRPTVNSEAFDKKISTTISFSVPVMGVSELKEMKEDVILLDARPQKEYDVSHIDGAKRIGFKKLDESVLEGIDKDEQIVIYCSIGYRSEKVGEKLKKMGYKNVYNLYGSIFEWINQGHEVVDKDNQSTQKVHTYNKRWSKWVEDGKAEKIW